MSRSARLLSNSFRQRNRLSNGARQEDPMGKGIESVFQPNRSSSGQSNFRSIWGTAIATTTTTCAAAWMYADLRQTELKQELNKTEEYGLRTRTTQESHYACDATRSNGQQSCFHDSFGVLSLSRTACEEDDLPLDSDDDYPSGHTEADRFYDSLEYHRSLLPDYFRRWFGDEREKDNDTWTAWPRKKIPSESDVASLEMDLQFCQRSPDIRAKVQSCRDQQFRIATFYVTQKNDPNSLMKGYKMVKELAEQGHPDGMCLYGIILNEGWVPGIDINPQQAVVWWRRCVDHHRHMMATYELAVAMYTGEGVPENTAMAVRFFRRAAHLGHAGAAYMLGECLLDGVGIDPDRSNALEWLVTAAELGHKGARRRVILILNEDYEFLDSGHAELSSRKEEVMKWVNADQDEEKARAVNIERRFTIGGGSRNPAILERRKTKVAESRANGIAYNDGINVDADAFGSDANAK